MARITTWSFDCTICISTWVGWSITLTVTNPALPRDFCLMPSMATTVIVLSGFGFNFNKSAIGLVHTETSALVSITNWHSVRPIFPYILAAGCLVAKFTR